MAFFIANVYEYWFFSDFHINIYSYTTTPEIFSAFLPVFNISLLLSAGFLISVNLILNNYVASIRKKKRTFSTFRHIANTKRRYFKILFWVILILIFSIFPLEYFIRNTEFGNNINLYMVIPIGALMMLSICLMFFIRFRKNKSKFYLWAIIFLSLFLANALTADLALIIANSIKKGPINVVATYYTKDCRYTTNDSVRYIASTERFIFLFVRGRNHNKTIVLKKDDLIKPIEIEYPKKPWQ